MQSISCCFGHQKPRKSDIKTKIGCQQESACVSLQSHTCLCGCVFMSLMSDLKLCLRHFRVLQNILSYRTKLWRQWTHYSEVMMSAVTSQITGVSIVYSTVCSSADQRRHQSSASLAFMRGIHRWPLNSSHKGSVTLHIFSFDDVIMCTKCVRCSYDINTKLDVMDQ